MNWLIFHIASGTAFFSGAVLIVISAGLSLHTKKGVRRWATLPCLIGVIVVAASATPLPYWFYGLLAASTVGWLYFLRSRTCSRKRQLWASALFVGVWGVAVGVEIPFHLLPNVETVVGDKIIIYADSITAGIGEGEAETWPSILRRTNSADVTDRSRMGATVKSVLARVEEDDVPPGVVILEIGGNDLLGHTTIADFERDLDRLLARLVKQHKRVVIFELPLPPFFNAFGMIQRRLARKHGVALIPKRVLMGVLSDSNATLDSIHLTQRGHELLAAAVWRILHRDE